VPSACPEASLGSAEASDVVDAAKLFDDDAGEVVVGVGFGGIEVVVDWASEDISRSVEKNSCVDEYERLLLE
jgi:hypothetical protein